MQVNTTAENTQLVVAGWDGCDANIDIKGKYAYNNYNNYVFHSMVCRF